jgi:hypothetical protein
MTSARYRLADGTFRQDWSNANLITAANDWSQVPSIMGYRGDDVVTSTGVDPRTITAANSSEVSLNVVANLTNPSAVGLSGGVLEFDGIPNRTIALNGSGTADAPSIVAYFDATGVENIRFQCNIRDLDSSADNAAQQVAVQCRVGGGAWTNIGYFADVTTANAATQVTAVVSSVSGWLDTTMSSIPIVSSLPAALVVITRICTSDALFANAGSRMSTAVTWVAALAVVTSAK